MSKALFAEQAEQFLSVVVKTWAMRTTFTSAEAADVLVQHAVKSGFLRERGRLLPGSTLNCWGRNKDAPRWAMQSAMSMLLADGWLPDDNTEWAAFAALFIMSNGGESLELVLKKLPAGIDTEIAAGWLCAASENAARWRERKKVMKT